MRKTQSKIESVQVLDFWPPVELSTEEIPQERALEWAEERIVQLKTCNLRFVRAMDIAEVDPAELSEEFARNLEFFGTADSYLTLTLQMLRSGNCKPDEIPPLFKAITLLAGSLGEARRQMLSSMADTLKSGVLKSELRAPAGLEDVEEELAELRDMPAEPKPAKNTRK